MYSRWNPPPLDPPPHPSLEAPAARLLYFKMADLSQEYLCAGWIRDNEFDLWQAIHSDTHEYGFGRLKYEDLEELRALSDRAQGWIWTGPGKPFVPQLATFAEWQAILAQRPPEPEPDDLVIIR